MNKQDWIKDHDHDIYQTDETMLIHNDKYAIWWCNDDECMYSEYKQIEDGTYRLGNNNYCAHCYNEIDLQQLNDLDNSRDLFYLKNKFDLNKRKKGRYYCSPTCVIKELLEGWF